MTDVAAMEPMLVPVGDSDLDDLAFELNRRTAGLAGSTRPEIQRELGAFRRAQ
jgi:hypothetical protein